MRKYVLLKFEDNWADEMNVYGFIVISGKGWQLEKARLEAITDCITLYIGSNEELEWSDGADLLSRIEVEQLRDDEAGAMKKHFPTGARHTTSHSDIVAKFGVTYWFGTTANLSSEDDE